MAKRKPKWEKRIIKMPENHGWTAKPGNKVFVANRGAVMFEIPQDWVVKPGESGSIRFFDHEDEDDAKMRLEVSVMQDAMFLGDEAAMRDLRVAHSRPAVDWSAMPLTNLLENLVQGDERGVENRSRVREARRRDLEVVWTQTEFTDPNENRKAYSRHCLARGPRNHSYISLDFWPEHTSLANRVWNDMLGSLKIGDYIEDPAMASRMN